MTTLHLTEVVGGVVRGRDGRPLLASRVESRIRFHLCFLTRTYLL